MKPFSTYPEDREKLMSLARVLQNPHDIETGEKAADELSDLVLAILSDEETDQFDSELDAADLMKIDDAWQSFKNAGPVAKVINNNQPGNTAIIEVLRVPPTLDVGMPLFASNLRDAAPELLECLKDARRLLTDQDAIDLEHIDEVIAKATGGENADWYAKRAKEERDAGREQNALSYEAFGRAALSPDNSTQKKEG